LKSSRLAWVTMSGTREPKIVKLPHAAFALVYSAL
jgi:hypothetical protein